MELRRFGAALLILDELQQRRNLKLVQDFWDGKRPVDWPDAVPFPVKRIELPPDWVKKRREESGL